MIYITNLKESINFGLNHFKEEQNNAIIRIVDDLIILEENKINNFIYKYELDLEFLDICVKKYNYFNEGLLNKCVEFFKIIKDADNVLLHCFGGTSRSPAIAIGYCMSKNDNKEIERIFRNKLYIPNSLVIKSFIEYYNYNNEYIEKLINFNTCF